MPAGMNEDVFSLPEGAIILHWPERLSKVSAADAQEWLELIGRKIKRAADAPADDDLPTLASLRGLISNVATNDLSAVDFVHRLRNDES